MAEPGNVLLSADYSQVELRVLAHIADEQVLKEIFIRGEDVHTATAREVFEVAEADIDAGHALEGQDGQLRDRLRPQRLRPRRPPEHPARGGQEFIDAYLERFPRVAAFIERDDRAGDRARAT